MDAHARVPARSHRELFAHGSKAYSYSLTARVASGRYVQTLQLVSEESQFEPVIQLEIGQVSLPQSPVAQLTSHAHASKQSIVPHEFAPSQVTRHASNPQVIAPQLEPAAQVISQL
jgi:hypothetical protein